MSDKIKTCYSKYCILPLCRITMQNFAVKSLFRVLKGSHKKNIGPHAMKIYNKLNSPRNNEKNHVFVALKITFRQNKCLSLFKYYSFVITNNKFNNLKGGRERNVSSSLKLLLNQILLLSQIFEMSVYIVITNAQLELLFIC